jgi:hypothetical protein
MVAILFGILTALVVIILTVLLSKQFQKKLFAATMLCAIAFIYVGFALKGNTLNSIVLEVLVALVFYFVSMIGFVNNSRLIAYGILLHGVWDILHHQAWAIQTNVPHYWPSYCLVADLILGIYFVLYFKMRKE